MVINGAVIENIGPNAKLLVHNESSILREKEVLSLSESTTPASRVYFAVQCAYMFPEQQEDHLKSFNQYLTDYVKAAPSAAPIADKMRESVAEGKFYRALKSAHDLVNHEYNIFKGMENDVLEKAQALDIETEIEPVVPTES